MQLKTVLITGGSGFLGVSLGNRLKNNYRVVLASRNNKNSFVASRLTGCEAVPLDIANIESVRDVFGNVRPNIVVHAAATKFVDLSEKFPHETIDVNIVGSQNIARVVKEFNVEGVINISTDKAAPPCKNTYAISKALTERMFAALSTKEVPMISVRYGNVAWSTGSVLPIWHEMIKRTGVIESCGAQMYRYLFTVEDAVDVVVSALQHIEKLAGSILVKNMKSTQIKDLLRVVCEQTGARAVYKEARQGERLTEYLVGKEELNYTRRMELDGAEFFQIDFREYIAKPEIEKEISAETSIKLNDDELRNIIRGIEA